MERDILGSSTIHCPLSSPQHILWPPFDARLRQMMTMQVCQKRLATKTLAITQLQDAIKAIEIRFLHSILTHHEIFSSFLYPKGVPKHADGTIDEVMAFTHGMFDLNLPSDALDNLDAHATAVKQTLRWRAGSNVARRHDTCMPRLNPTRGVAACIDCSGEHGGEAGDQADGSQGPAGPSSPIRSCKDDCGCPTHCAIT
eukprot:SAG31_NODE_4620_length_3090_cov_5.096958_2_plen_199_part_00